MTVSAIGRAAGPAICGPILTWGVQNNYIIAPWWTLSFIALLGAVPVWWIEEDQKLSSPETDVSPEEDRGESRGELR